MAKKEEKKLERVYNVPLRKEWLKVPKYKRAKKAIKALREFLIKHMKPAEDEKGRVLLKIGKMANLDVWKHGIKNPPHHIKVKAVKGADGVVKAELVGFEYKEEKKEKKEKKGKVEQLKEKLTGKVGEEKKEVKEEKKEEVKKEAEAAPKKEAAPKEGVKNEPKESK